MGWIIKFEFHLHISRSDGRKVVGDKPENDEQTQKLFAASARLLIERLKSSLSISTITNYKTALRSFLLYLKNDIDISNVDSDLIRGYERWLRERNVCLNSISCYMRSLRSLLTKLGHPDPSPIFNGVYTGKMKTEKRAIGESELARIKQMTVKPGSFLSLVRDIFLFSFYALGMPFIDVAFLRKSQLKDNKLTYFRHKTGQPITICLEPCMLDIIQRYQTADSIYVFPLIRSEIKEVAQKEYLSLLSQYNHALKQLAAKAGIKHLSSYTVRHTWASLAFGNNVELPIISKALGHTNTQTTLTYIKGIDDSRLDEANRMIISRI